MKFAAAVTALSYSDPFPEIPAISRSSMTISITGEPTGEYSPQMMPHLYLAADKAKAFLLALREGRAPIIVADSRSAFEVEFAITEDGPTFTVRKPVKSAPCDGSAVGEATM